MPSHESVKRGLPPAQVGKVPIGVDVSKSGEPPAVGYSLVESSDLAGGGGGGGGIAGVASVKNDGTDVPAQELSTIPFVEGDDGIDTAVATLSGGALHVVNDGVMFVSGDFGPNNAPLANVAFAITRNGDVVFAYRLPSGEFDAPLEAKFAKVEAGDVIAATVSNNDPGGTATNNFYFVLTLAFVG